jgi:hypothetical protein
LAAGGCGSALAHPGRSASCRKKKVWEGALGAFLSVPPLLTARVGAGGAGFDRGFSQEHGYRPEANGDSDHHSDHDLSPICLPGVRSNVRKKFKFEFLKFSTLGGQHIGQGFQSYFCYKEMLSFAEIVFAFLSIVIVSDSNFG